MDPPPTSELAIKCLAQFDKCLLSEALTRSQWAENRRADFNIWLDGLGAMAEKTASVDSRSDSTPHELILTRNLLLQLHNYLEDTLSANDKIELEEAKGNVNTAIENLASMAVAIRQTERKSRQIRADRSFNSADLEDFRIYLKCVVLFKQTLPDGEYYPHHKVEPLWWKDDLEKNLTPLQQRLIEANLRRRHRFTCAQRGADRLAHHPPIGNLTTENLTTEDFTEEVFTLEEFRVHQRQTKIAPVQPERVSVPKQLGIRPATSGTLASIPETRLRWKESQNVVQVANTQLSFVTRTTKYPGLRNPLVPTTETMGQDKIEMPKRLKCPCCCQPIPYSFLDVESAWKKHLSKDLYPYTCIASNCPVPRVLYSTRAEWEDHLRKGHAKSWRCQLCDSSDNITFRTDDRLLKHVRKEHMDSFPESLLETVRRWPSSPLIGLDSCPLCNESGSRDAPGLITHVLKHTHDFALHSLPWADLPFHGLESSTTLGAFNISYLQPLQLIKPSESVRLGLMNDWFETLDIPIPKKGGWERAEAALRDLTASRADINVGNEEGYFTRNDYFASDSEGESLDLQRGQSLSRCSFETKSAKNYHASDAEAMTLDPQPGQSPIHDNFEAESKSMTEGMKSDIKISRWPWSRWIWNEEHQRFYRERQDRNGNTEIEWHYE